MKILMLGSGSIKSNFAYRLLALGKALAKRGNKVSIVAPRADKYNDFKPEDTSDIKDVRVLHPFQFATKRIEVNLLPYIFSAVRMVLREKPDLVYIYKPTPISIVGLVAKLRRIPVVLDMDDLGSEVMRIEGHPWHQRKLVEWSEKFASRYADRLVVASTYLRELYQQQFPKKPIHVLPNGVESDWFTDKANPSKQPSRIVFMGSLNRKNIVEPLIDALPTLAKKHPKLDLLLIGDGKYLSYFKKKIAKLRVSRHVEYTGWLKLDDARAKLYAGDIGYNYMPDTPTVRAASNMKVPQYMAKGVVPLVSDMGDLPWMVDNGKAGYIAAPDNQEDLERVLDAALSDKKRKLKAKNAVAYAKNAFDWDKLAAGLEPWLQGLRQKKEKRSLLKRMAKHYATWTIAGLGLLNLLVWSGLDFWHVGTAFVAGYMLLAPGLLILSLLAGKRLPLMLGVAASAALSVATLIGSGLLVNTVLPLLGNLTPLRLGVLLPTFNAVVLLLTAVTIWRKRRFPIAWPKFNGVDTAVVFGSLLMPVLAVMGATSLNNGGSNLFTMLALALVGLYAPLLIFLKKRLNVEVMPIALYAMSLAILLMSSMRGWFITGHDVLREHHVFLLAENTQRWNIGAFRDPYNACLSLTILPTYINNLIQITDVYIYKFVFQFIGALPVVPIFYLCRRYMTGALAFLAGFMYITFPTFMVDMSMLNRQGVAFLFFSMLLFVLLTNHYILGRKRSVMLYTLGAAMVVSHYSTSYVAVTMLVLAYVLNMIGRWFLAGNHFKRTIAKLANKMPNKHMYRRPLLLTLPFAAAMLLWLFAWNGPITNTSKGISETVKRIATSVSAPFIGDKSDAGPTTSTTLVSDINNSRQDLFNQFAASVIKETRSPELETNLFPLNVTNKPEYAIKVIDEPSLKEGWAGKRLVSVIPVALGNLYESIKQSYAKLLQVLLLLGLVGLGLGLTFHRILDRRPPTEFMALVIAGLMMIIFQVVMPQAGIDYGLLRLFQQNLVLMVLPITLGLLLLVGLVFKKLNWQIAVLGTALTGFFFILSGFIPQITGGSRAALYLNNSGFYYDAYYTHASEVAGFQWLKENADTHKYPLQADRYFNGTKMQAYTGMIPETRLLPATIKRNSYVFMGVTNIKNGDIIEYQGADIIYYKFPMNFIETYKNRLYDTGTSRVYK